MLGILGLPVTPENTVAVSAACAGISVLAAAVAIRASTRRNRVQPSLPANHRVSPGPAAPATWPDAYFDGVMRWADAACRDLALAIHLAESPASPDCERRFSELRASLSHLIDTGYWYFPNSGDGSAQADHPPAYRGVRHPALDLLVAARELVGKTDPIGVAALVRAKREFVSHIQILLNPRVRDRGIAGVLRRFETVGEEAG